MKTHKLLVLCFALAHAGISTQAQGTFQNLDFESASPAGYSPGVGDFPVTAAFPGWGVYYSSPGVGTKTATTVWYDAVSLGGAFVSLNDTGTGFGFTPIQGMYSAYLFGGPSSYFPTNGAPTYSAISQTGLIPTGTMSVLMDVKAGNGFTVSLGGQPINMIALQIFPNYTRYAGDVSAFAGLTAQLTISAPPTGVPNGVLLDDIGFSPESVPEPGVFGLWVPGALLVGGRVLGRRTGPRTPTKT